MDFLNRQVAVRGEAVVLNHQAASAWNLTATNMDYYAEKRAQDVEGGGTSRYGRYLMRKRAAMLHFKLDAFSSSICEPKVLTQHQQRVESEGNVAMIQQSNQIQPQAPTCATKARSRTELEDLRELMKAKVDSFLSKTRAAAEATVDLDIASKQTSRHESDSGAAAAERASTFRKAMEAASKHPNDIAASRESSYIESDLVKSEQRLSIFHERTDVPSKPSSPTKRGRPPSLLLRRSSSLRIGTRSTSPLRLATAAFSPPGLERAESSVIDQLDRLATAATALNTPKVHMARWRHLPSQKDVAVNLPSPRMSPSPRARRLSQQLDELKISWSE